MNAKMVDLLAAVFQRRYEPNFALGNIASTLAAHKGAIGAWLPGAADMGVTPAEIPDVTGSGRTLAGMGVLSTSQAGLSSYISMDGATNYLTRPTETGIELTGALSVGGWFYFNSSGADQGMISKWYGITPQRAYRLYRAAAGILYFDVSPDGTAVTSVTSSAVADNTWVFCGGYYVPSTTLAVVINRTWFRNAVAIPAAVFNSSEPLDIGRTTRAFYMPGRVAAAFVCRGALSETDFNNFYEQTRALFNV